MKYIVLVHSSLIISYSCSVDRSSGSWWATGDRRSSGSWWATVDRRSSRSWWATVDRRSSWSWWATVDGDSWSWWASVASRPTVAYRPTSHDFFLTPKTTKTEAMLPEPSSQHFGTFLRLFMLRNQVTLVPVKKFVLPVCSLYESRERQLS